MKYIYYIKLCYWRKKTNKQTHFALTQFVSFLADCQNCATVKLIGFQSVSVKHPVSLEATSLKFFAQIFSSVFAWKQVDSGAHLFLIVSAIPGHYLQNLATLLTRPSLLPL